MNRHMFWSQPNPCANSMGCVPRPKTFTLLRARTSMAGREAGGREHRQGGPASEHGGDEEAALGGTLREYVEAGRNAPVPGGAVPFVMRFRALESSTCRSCIRADRSAA